MDTKYRIQKNSPIKSIHIFERKNQDIIESLQKTGAQLVTLWTKLNSNYNKKKTIKTSQVRCDFEHDNSKFEGQRETIKNTKQIIYTTGW